MVITMSLIGHIVGSVLDETIGAAVLDNAIKGVDTLEKKQNKKLFEVPKGKKVLIVNQKLYTYKDYINVFDEYEKIKYKVIGEFSSIKHHLHIYDFNNNEIGKVIENLFAFRKPLSLEIKPVNFDFYKNKKKIVKMKSKSGFKDKLLLSNGWIVKGSFFKFNYKVYDKNDNELCSVQTKLLYYGDTYKVVFDEKCDELLILMIVLAIDIYNAPSKINQYKETFKHNINHPFGSIF